MMLFASNKPILTCRASHFYEMIVHYNNLASSHDKVVRTYKLSANLFFKTRVLFFASYDIKYVYTLRQA